MSDFRDPELERLFGRDSGPTPDVDVAYQRVQGRVRQVKRRRAVAVSGAACSLLFAAAVFAGTRSDGGNSVQPGGSDTGVDGSPLTVSGSSDMSSPTTDEIDTATITTITGDDTVATSPTPSTPSTSPGATSGAAPTTAASVPAPSSTAPAVTSSVTNLPVPPVTQTFGGVGGSITVQLQNGTVTLVSYNASSGFSVDVQQSSGVRVEVRFESSDRRTDIRVDIVGISMSPEIDEN